MSIEVILVPVALAAAAKWVATKRSTLKNAEQMVCLETQFRDVTLLQKALQDFQCPYVMDGAQVESSHGQGRLIFAPNNQGVFNAYVLDHASIKEAQSFLAELHDQYKRLVQQQSYETLIQRAHDQGLSLEQEEILEDNSVVLTFTIS